MVRRRMIWTLVALSMVVTACSSGDDDEAAADDDSSEGTEVAETVERPDGPAAEISGPLTGGNGLMLAAPSAGPDL